MSRSLSIFGATGSVGEQTLDLVRRNRADWNVVALTANSNVAALADAAREFAAEVAVVADERYLDNLRDALAGSGIEAAAGRSALCEAAARPVDMTVAAIVGCAGLGPVMAAIEQGGTIALANKEALVSAGEVMTAAVDRHGATLLPVDSEHNAIFQCLQGGELAVVLVVLGGELEILARLHGELLQALSLGVRLGEDSVGRLEGGAGVAPGLRALRGGGGGRAAVSLRLGEARAEAGLAEGGAQDCGRAGGDHREDAEAADERRARPADGARGGPGVDGLCARWRGKARGEEVRGERIGRLATAWEKIESGVGIGRARTVAVEKRGVLGAREHHRDVRNCVREG